MKSTRINIVFLALAVTATFFIISSLTGDMTALAGEGTNTATISVTTEGSNWDNYNIIDYSSSILGGTASSWSWNFDDGNTATSSSGKHTYSKANTYKVEVSAKLSDSSTTVKNTTTVTIKEPALVASAKLDLDLSDETLKYDSRTPGAVSWSWNFGDGGTSTLDNGTHVYTKPNDYTVKLTVRSPAGNTSYYSERIDMNKLMAYFEASPVKGGAPLTVTFDDRSYKNPDKDYYIKEWYWNFHDSGSDNNTLTKKTGANVKHTFEKNGNYTVSLTVTDKNRNTDTYSTVISVGDEDAPEARFTLDDDYEKSGKSPLKVKFIDKSKPSDKTKVDLYKWEWTVYDEKGSKYKQIQKYKSYDPEFEFTDPGTYTIKLVVTDDKGFTDTETKKDYVKVTLDLSATFTASPTSGHKPLDVTFTATPAGSNDYPVSKYYWEYGDGYTDTTTSKMTTHSYKSTGTYTVKLTVTDTKSHTYTYSRSNYITVSDISSITAATTPTPAPTKTIVTTGSSGTKIFGIPGTEYFRSEMNRFYGFYEEYVNLLSGIFGM
ncbi:PKD repeat protein [Methanomicrobium sp. W14]|uniref:PKD domain-containing protein n=1 Tax=Methanomicrobium sp. W14 TaxID=2817839 RepID=UPI001AE31CD7|nr:PKD domain-containing protein [Methanomicrobium sp. W14]MBP2134119.1 PKD repeat protein [Methanomicrobium sp. W14]